MPSLPVDGWSQFYVPEIHDIHPGMTAELDAMLGILPAAARDLAALLVVPNWQGRAPISDDAGFLRRLAGLPGTLVLHGWTHSLGPDFVNWLLYGHDNRSEFARLNRAEARERIDRGLEAFAGLGVKPRWFCAPRWQQSTGAAGALTKSGIPAFMLHDRFEFASGVKVPLPALNFDEGDRKVRNRIMHALRKGTIRRLLDSGRPFRLALHPADVHDDVAWRQIGRVVGRLQAEGWAPVGPDDAAARWERAVGRIQAAVPT